MEITITVSEEMQRKLQELAQESGLSVADCAHDMLEGSLDRLRSPSSSAVDPVERYLTNLRCRTPEELAETQRLILAASRPRRIPPPGKTIADMVVGKWPGNETDAEIRAALEELS